MLTVGSDCAIGKMTVALELDREARAPRNRRRVFVPTGQTGIAIAGWGISVDAVVADFIAGASERLVVEGHARGGELLWSRARARSSIRVLGRHARPLSRLAPHASSSATSPASRDRGRRVHPIPPLRELVELHERISLTARPARVAAIALNTRELDEDAARAAVAASRGNRPAADDPVGSAPDRLLDAVLAAVVIMRVARLRAAVPPVA